MTYLEVDGLKETSHIRSGSQRAALRVAREDFVTRSGDPRFSCRLSWMQLYRIVGPTKSAATLRFATVPVAP